MLGIYQLEKRRVLEQTISGRVSYKSLCIIIQSSSRRQDKKQWLLHIYEERLLDDIRKKYPNGRKSSTPMGSGERLLEVFVYAELPPVRDAIIMNSCKGRGLNRMLSKVPSNLYINYFVIIITPIKSQ